MINVKGISRKKYKDVRARLNPSTYDLLTKLSTEKKLSIKDTIIALIRAEANKELQSEQKHQSDILSDLLANVVKLIEINGQILEENKAIRKGLNMLVTTTMFSNKNVIRNFHSVVSLLLFTQQIGKEEFKNILNHALEKTDTEYAEVWKTVKENPAGVVLNELSKGGKKSL